MAFSPTDQIRVSTAVASAEALTDGEIVPVVAARSDAYHDVVLHWSLLALLAMIALASFRPEALVAIHALLAGGWVLPPTPGALLRILLFAAVLVFLLVRYAIGVTPLRYALVPGATKARRVRRRAVDLFRVGVQTHTMHRNGVLLYLSLAEHRAEIVVDSAVHAAVPPEQWGDILSDLLVEVRAGRPADGMIAAIAAIGSTLATHFPHSGGDTAELPDRLIQL